MQQEILSIAKGPVARVQLDYLDGLRGVAALFVVLGHACQFYLMTPLLKDDTPSLVSHTISVAYGCCFTHGHYAVDLFIILSGYCLMLPIARSPDGRMVGGFFPYIKRRARRILPPYYAALLFCLALIAFVPGMNTPADSWWDRCLPAFRPGVLISHLFLLHNHSPAWDTKIDSPMWSIAVEWQIYFLFPLLLLPAWRSLGSVAVVGLAYAMGVGCSYMRPNPGGDYAWLVGLFAMGMVGAVVSVGTGVRECQWRERIAWGKTAAVLSGIIVIWNVLQRAAWQHVSALHWIRLETWGSEWPMDLLVGGAAACLLIHLRQCATPDRPGRPSRLLQMLHSPKVVALGLFSYSLYLTHAPVLELMHLSSRRMHLGSTAAGLFLFLGAVPLAVLVAYLFHLVFERPFMTSHMRTAAKRLGTQSSGAAT